MTTPPLLGLCARLELDDAQLDELARVARTVDDWPTVAEQAEAHGVAPLVWRYLRTAGAPVPEVTARVFRALVGRHQHAARARAVVLGELLHAFEAAGIEAVVLKGAALACLVYPAPELRPMRDLDLLVRPADARRAQALLVTLGFDAPREPARRLLRWHHHLPPVVRAHDGLRIAVEIHQNAFSVYADDSLGLDTLAAPTQEFAVAGRSARALGHVDMLRHLCGHALEPAFEMPLITVADIVGYAARFESQIDWDRLGRACPVVPNLLSLLHYLCPLPPVLARFRPAANVQPPTGIGKGLVPLLTLATSRAAPSAVLHELLYPSEWWLRARYAVRPDASLEYVRWRRHLPRLVWWGLRRTVAAISPPFSPIVRFRNG